MFSHISFSGHERVVYVHDIESGLKAIIGLHSTALGPAAGGCRLRQYETDNDALHDVLRLSRGMSYKNAMAGLPLGGGKAVILGPIEPSRRAAVFKAFGAAVETLGGAYLTAQDLGVSKTDLREAHSNTSFVIGADPNGILAEGPARFTARGVLKGMAIAAKHAFGTEDLAGRSVVVQGVGGVGGRLAHLLAQAGAQVFIADVNMAAAQSLSDKIGAQIVELETCLLADVDILAPCALGGVIDGTIADRIHAKVIAGGANNQLSHPEVGDTLAARGITYVPDYVLNAGGIIAVAAQYFSETKEAPVMAQVDAIAQRVEVLLTEAAQSGAATNRVADDMAQAILDRAGKTAHQAIAV